MSIKATSKPENGCYEIGYWGPVRTALVSYGYKAGDAVQNHKECEYECGNSCDNSINRKEKDQKTTSKEEDRQMDEGNDPGDELIHPIAIDAHSDEYMVERASSRAFVKHFASVDVLSVGAGPLLDKGRQQCAD